MQVKSVYKYARISCLKAREVTRAIQGMPVSNALAVLAYTPKKAAFLVGKTLQSAVANAENNHEIDPDTLIVKSATATEGPSLSRIMPRARGSAAAIKKRMTHITVILDQKPESEKKDGAKAASAAEVVSTEKPKAKRARKAQDS
ncbi:MAG: 50S ribosomal protein L22 [Verrucomicrobiaceae bacterium]|nr:50S ribosomal protein L22 [Verrucomicrobiaceae bacterium]